MNNFPLYTEEHQSYVTGVLVRLVNDVNVISQRRSFVFYDQIRYRLRSVPTADSRYI